MACTFSNEGTCHVEACGLPCVGELMEVTERVGRNKSFE